MKKLANKLDIGDLAYINYLNCKTEYDLVPVFITEIGEDYIEVESFYGETELELDYDAFETDEDVQNYVDQNMDSLVENSIIVHEKFILPLHNITSINYVSDEETIDMFIKNRERYESTIKLRNMFKNSEEN